VPSVRFLRRAKFFRIPQEIFRIPQEVFRCRQTHPALACHPQGADNDAAALNGAASDTTCDLSKGRLGHVARPAVHLDAQVRSWNQIGEKLKFDKDEQATQHRPARPPR
jgi:hypothetical protein